MHDKIKEFMEHQIVSFDQMIRCFNFGEFLSSEEEKRAMKNYENGDHDKYEWY